MFLTVFILIYWGRPNYWIPGATRIPFAKIAGLLAVACFFQWFVLERRGAWFPREMTYLILLFAQLILAIPFGLWPGGSFAIVIQEYSKVVAVTLVAAMTVTTLARLRRLVFIQTAVVILMAAVALSGSGARLSSAIGERLGGMFGGTYENPNDFALDLALVFPFAFAFLLGTRNLVWKVVWFLGMGLIIYVILMTYSRGGLIALVVGMAVSIWEFAVKGRRHHWIPLLAFSGLAIFVLMGPVGYTHRVLTILNPNADITGSAVDRRALFDRAVAVTARHPLFGVGPGNFAVVSGMSFARDWHGTHNSYLQLSSEAGIPALILFLLILKQTFSNVRRAKQFATGDMKLVLLVGGLRASLASLAVGLFFTDAAYHFFPYFLVAFCSAACQIAQMTAGSQPSRQASQPANA
jgi:O-antigen ligase